MFPPRTYSVVGVRPDGTRHILCIGLTWDRAAYVQRALGGVIAFREILVELEGASEPDPE
jgi:hypothetical protein